MTTVARQSSDSAPKMQAATAGIAKWLRPNDSKGSRSARLTSSALIRKELRFQLEHALFRGVLQPGDFIGTERELADAFGLSRVPVRDAIRALEAQGLIKAKVGRLGGLFVANQDTQGLTDALSTQIHLLGCGVEDVFQAQGQLLAGIVDLATNKLTLTDQRSLEKSLHLMMAALDDDEEFLSESVGFLMKLAEVAGNLILQYQLRALFEFIVEHHRPYNARKYGERVVRRHRKLLNLLSERDTVRARAHVIAHSAWMAGLRKAL